MNIFYPILEKFCLQAQNRDLYTVEYPKTCRDFELRVSFGMGQPARIPWIAFLAPEMKVSRGIYPVYLYYKDLQTLVLAYGISETEEPNQNWPNEITQSTEKIEDFFDQMVARYGDSFIYRAYGVRLENKKVVFFDRETNDTIEQSRIEKDLSGIINDYAKIVSKIAPDPTLFYMEKQLEDFLIENWEKTELSKQYDLIIENGVLLSKQYKTNIGNIDILVTEKKTNCLVVIELKKNQTSDDTVGQITRYMGWLKEHKAKQGVVKGIIIAARYDKRLDYALKMVPNIDVYLYEVDFKLRKFTKQ